MEYTSRLFNSSVIHIDNTNIEHYPETTKFIQ